MKPYSRNNDIYEIIEKIAEFIIKLKNIFDKLQKKFQIHNLTYHINKLINFCGIRKGKALVRELSEYREYLNSLKEFIESLQGSKEVVYNINGIEYFTDDKFTDFERCVSGVLEAVTAAAEGALGMYCSRPSGGECV